MKKIYITPKVRSLILMHENEVMLVVSGNEKGSTDGTEDGFSQRTNEDFGWDDEEDSSWGW